MPSSRRSQVKKLTPPTVSIPDTMPGAGRRRYVRLDSHPGDPDPSGATQGIALQDPDLLDSIVKGYADQRRAETLSSAVSRHRDAALCPLAQTAGFRSDATSDCADRLYIVNRDEVMCRAETVRRLQRRSSDAVSVIVSMEPRPTSPASQALELSSRDSLQLRAHFAAMSTQVPTS